MAHWCSHFGHTHALSDAGCWTCNSVLASPTAQDLPGLLLALNMTYTTQSQPTTIAKLQSLHSAHNQSPTHCMSCAAQQPAAGSLAWWDCQHAWLSRPGVGQTSSCAHSSTNREGWSPTQSHQCQDPGPSAVHTTHWQQQQPQRRRGEGGSRVSALHSFSTTLASRCATAGHIHCTCCACDEPMHF